MQSVSSFILYKIGTPTRTFSQRSKLPTECIHQDIIKEEIELNPWFRSSLSPIEFEQHQTLHTMTSMPNLHLDDSHDFQELDESNEIK